MNTPFDNQYPVGLYCHSYGEKQFLNGDAAIEYQGLVVGVDGDYAFVLLFSWLDGRGDMVIVVPKLELYGHSKKGDCWTLYPNKEEMQLFYEKHSRDHAGEEPFEI